MPSNGFVLIQSNACGDRRVLDEPGPLDHLRKAQSLFLHLESWEQDSKRFTFEYSLGYYFQEKIHLLTKYPKSMRYTRVSLNFSNFPTDIEGFSTSGTVFMLRPTDSLVHFNRLAVAGPSLLYIGAQRVFTAMQLLHALARSSSDCHTIQLWWNVLNKMT